MLVCTSFTIWSGKVYCILFVSPCVLLRGGKWNGGRMRKDSCTSFLVTWKGNPKGWVFTPDKANSNSTGTKTQICSYKPNLFPKIVGLCGQTNSWKTQFLKGDPRLLQEEIIKLLLKLLACKPKIQRCPWCKVMKPWDWFCKAHRNNQKKETNLFWYCKTTIKYHKILSKSSVSYAEPHFIKMSQTTLWKCFTCQQRRKQ